MKKKTAPTTSVVIPAYNEEDRIRLCLQALVNQKTAFTEIIVVDNNSDDKTVNICNEFGDVRVLRQSKQGQKYAQATGFDAAIGEIIVRIDADTIVPGDYSEKIIKFMASRHAVTGYGVSYTGLGKRVLTFLLLSGYYAQERAVLGTDVFWGANMAMTKELWDRSKRYIDYSNGKLIEDIELAVAVAMAGFKVEIIRDLIVSVDYIRTSEVKKYLNYAKKQIVTQRAFKQRLSGRLEVNRHQVEGEFVGYVDYQKLKMPKRVFNWLVYLYVYPLLAIILCIYWIKTKTKL